MAKEASSAHSSRQWWSKPSDDLGSVSFSSVHLGYVLPTVIGRDQARNRQVPVDVVEKLRDCERPWPNQANLQGMSIA
jgi:hypothetical protein